MISGDIVELINDGKKIFFGFKIFPANSVETFVKCIDKVFAKYGKPIFYQVTVLFLCLYSSLTH